MPLNIRDLNNHYGSTIVAMTDPETNRKIPFNIGDIFAHRGEPHVAGSYVKDQRWSALGEPVKLSELDLTWPTEGLVDCYKFTVYMERTSPRQWHKAYRPELIRFMFASWELAEYFGLRVRGGEPSFLESMFNRTYKSKEEALASVLSMETFTRALSPEVWVGHHLRHNGLIFGYKADVVGTVDDNGDFFLDPNCLGIQELVEECVGTVGVKEL